MEPRDPTIPEADYRATADPKGWADAFMDDAAKMPAPGMMKTPALVEAWFKNAILSGYATGFIDGEAAALSKNVEKLT